MKRIISTLTLLFMGLTVSFGQNITTFSDREVENSSEYINGNAFQKDMLLYVEMLSDTHPYYADAKHRSELQRRVHKMYRECGRITDTTDFKVYLAKIASSLNDGHTSIYYWSSFDRIFPIRLVIDGDAPAIIDVTSEEYRDLLGKCVTRINGRPIKEILKMARPLISADNRANFENSVKEYMMLSEFWSLLGMSDEVMQLTLNDGSSIVLHAINKNNLKIAQLQRDNSNRVTAQRNVLFDYTIYEDEGICYMQFNQFADRITHPKYPQLARFDHFTRDMLCEMEERGAETLVVDLQYNSGGNSILGDVLLSWLHPHQMTQRYSTDVRMSELLCSYYPYYRYFTAYGEPLEMGKLYNYIDFDHSKDYKIDYSTAQDSTKHVYNFDKEAIFDGNVIFIQGKNSFSSATLLLTLARDNEVGIIIGEPSGGSPSHYGDVLYCTLPNTNTIATISHKHFIRPNRALIGQDSIIPDVMIELNNSDKDMVWEWIVKHYGINRTAPKQTMSDDDDSYLWDTIYTPAINN